MAQPSVSHVIIILKGFGYSLRFAFFTDVDTTHQGSNALARVTSQLPRCLQLTSPWRNSYLPNKLCVLFQRPGGPNPSCPAATAGSVPAWCLAWEEIACWPTRVVLCNWFAGNAMWEDLAFFLIVCFIKVCLLKQMLVTIETCFLKPVYCQESRVGHWSGYCFPRIRSTHAALQASWVVSQHLLSSLFQLSSARSAVVMAPHGSTGRMVRWESLRLWHLQKTKVKSILQAAGARKLALNKPIWVPLAV